MSTETTEWRLLFETPAAQNSCLQGPVVSHESKISFVTAVSVMAGKCLQMFTEAELEPLLIKNEKWRYHKKRT